MGGPKQTAEVGHFIMPESLGEVGMIESRGEIRRGSVAEHAQVLFNFVRNDGADADFNRVQGFEHGRRRSTSNL